jgi:hypothetical protein
MIKKYLPFVALIGAASLLWWVKTHQRGASQPEKKERIEINIPSPADQPSVGPTPSEYPNRAEGFNRRASSIIYSKHARCRMECRHIDESEVKEILEKGTVNLTKVESDGRGKTYPLEGVTHDRQHVRIVFAPKEDGSVVVVTCIDLDTDWTCDCK